jgi:hypothetical protein
MEVLLVVELEDEVTELGMVLLQIQHQQLRERLVVEGEELEELAEQAHQVALVTLSSHINMENKIFAIIKKGIVIDGWYAKSKEEAMLDNPGCIVVELNEKNSPAHYGQPFLYGDNENE